MEKLPFHARNLLEARLTISSWGLEFSWNSIPLEEMTVSEHGHHGISSLPKSYPSQSLSQNHLEFLNLELAALVVIPATVNATDFLATLVGEVKGSLDCCKENNFLKPFWEVMNPVEYKGMESDSPVPRHTKLPNMEEQIFNPVVPLRPITFNSGCKLPCAHTLRMTAYKLNKI